MKCRYGITIIYRNLLQSFHPRAICGICAEDLYELINHLTFLFQRRRNYSKPGFWNNATAMIGKNPPETTSFDSAFGRQQDKSSVCDTATTEIESNRSSEKLGFHTLVDALKVFEETGVIQEVTILEHVDDRDESIVAAMDDLGVGHETPRMLLIVHSSASKFRC
ncbi:hypothetical protein HAX54_029535 [Datura stramonium]|uniref:Uncharacterized protein n=1 Tax=Datura stramonium TaxID=4076 RepID=A0ABS8V6Q6_DATST|nr:hypothetical protein [Datura stramonium]